MSDNPLNKYMCKTEFMCKAKVRKNLLNNTLISFVNENPKEDSKVLPLLQEAHRAHYKHCP